MGLRGKINEEPKINPLHAPTWNNLGNCYRQSADATDAEAALLEAIRLDSSYAAPLHNLGLLYASRGDMRGAMALYRKLMEIAPPKADQLLQEMGMAPQAATQSP